MKRGRIIILSCFFLAAFSWEHSPRTIAGDSTAAKESARLITPTSAPRPLPDITNENLRAPVYFVSNHGISDRALLYFIRNGRYSLGLEKTGFVFNAGGDYYRLDFIGARREVRVEGIDALPSVENYLIGSDPAAWKTDLHPFRAVVYNDLYAGINLQLYGHERDIEADWIVNPGARLGDIQLRIRDAEKTEIQDDGGLLISMKNSRWVHRRPAAYQTIDGKKVDIPVRFYELESSTYGFQIESYDPSRPLVIDPVMLAFSTFLGGDRDESGTGIAIDNQGNIYVAGVTTSSTFPVKGPVQRSLAGGSDVFVAKYAAEGKSLIYSTYIGGWDADRASGIAVDTQGSAYIVGTTASKDFPARNGYARILKGGKDAFVSKLNPKGNALLFSTFLGGTKDDEGAALALDKDRNVYITGTTASADFPIIGAFDAVLSRTDAFVVKLAANGRSLVFSTFLGGADEDEGKAIVLDAQGSAFVTGWTTSSDFPVKNAFDGDLNGGKDAFLIRFSQSGKALIYSTYLGGTSDDEGKAIALDSLRSPHVTGFTESVDFPVQGGFSGKLRGGKDVFVTKFQNTSQALLFSTYVGGNRGDIGYDIEVDKTGTIYVAGGTASPNFMPSSSEDRVFNSVPDGFLIRLDSLGKMARLSYLLGGSDDDVIYSLALGKPGVAYVAGSTASKDFPAKTSLDVTLTGPSDAFATMIVEPPVMISNIYTSLSSGPPYWIAVMGSGFGNFQGNRNLVINGVPAPSGWISQWHDNEIGCYFWIPFIWVDQLYKWTVTENRKVISNVFSNRYLLNIYYVTPSWASYNTAIDIYYRGSYRQPWSVCIGGIDAPVVSSSDGYIQVTCPTSSWKMGGMAMDLYFHDGSNRTISDVVSIWVY